MPRAALDGESTVWIVDSEDRLRSRRVTVLRLASEDAWLAADLVPGERVSLSRPLGLRDGLAVRPVPEEVVVGRLDVLEPAS